MHKFIISKKAKEDLHRIFKYIAQDNQKAAIKHNASFFKLFNLLSENPKMGVSKEEFGKNIRLIPIGNYLVFHRTSDYLEIVRVLHGARNIDKEFIN